MLEKFAFFLTFLWSITVLSLSPLPDIRTVTSIDQISSPSIRNRLNEEYLSPLNPSISPKVQELTKKVTQMVRDLWLPKDGVEPIYVMVSESLIPNASLTRDKSGHPILIEVSLGLFDEIENDDELRYILGHELEHIHADIGKYVELRQQLNLNNPVESAFLNSLAKAEENEADLKSVILRLHKKGYNPLAGISTLEKFQGTSGSNISATHTTNASRRHTLEMAITGLTRQMGERINAQPPSNTLIHLGKDILSDPSWETYRARQESEIMGRPSTVTHETLESIRKNEKLIQSNPSEPNKSNNFHNNEFVKRKIQLSKYQKELSLPEKIDRDLKLHKNLILERDHLRHKILGENFVPTSASQVVTLSEMDRLDLSSALVYSNLAPKITSEYDSIHQLQKSIAVISDHLPSASSKDREALQTQLSKYKNDLFKAQEKYNALLSGYEASPDLEAQIRKVAQFSLAAKGSPNAIEAHLALARQQREVGPLIFQAWSRRDQFLNQNLDLLIQGMREDFSIAPRVWKELLTGVDGVRTPPKLSELSSAFLEGYEAAFRNATTTEEKLKILKNMYLVMSSKEFKTLLTEQREIMSKMLNQYFRLNTRLATDYRELIGMSAKAMTNPFESSIVTSLISPETEALRRTRTLELMRTDLLKKIYPSSGLDPLFDLLDKLIQSESGWIMENSIQPLDPSISTEGSRLISAITRRIEMELGTQGYPGDKTRAAQLILQGRYPELMNLFSGTVPSFSYEEMSQIMHSLSSSPSLRESLKYRLTFDGLRQSKQADESFFKVLAESPEFIGNDRSRRINFNTPKDPLLKEKYEFMNWITTQRKDLSGLGFRVISSGHSYNYPSLQFSQDIPAFHSQEIQHYRNIERELSTLPPDQRLKQVLKKWVNDTAQLGWSEKTLLKVAPKDPRERVIFTRELLRLLNNFKEKNSKYPGAIAWLTQSSLSKTKEIQKILLGDLSKMADMSRYSLDAMIEIVTSPEIEVSRSSAWDYAFEKVWKKAKQDPEIRNRLLDERLVEKVYFKQNQEEFAKWQINERLGLFGADGKPKHQPKGPRNTSAIRSNVRLLKQIVDRQFEGNSMLKNSVIRFAEDALQTNQAENQLLQDSRLGTDNWFKSSELAYLDAPSEISKKLDNNINRFEYLEFLIGKRNDPPAFAQAKNFDSLDEYHLFEYIIKNSKRQFEEADLIARNYILQGLLDTKTGILSNPEDTEKVFKLVLNKNYKDPIFRSVVTSYLESIPASEKNVILGHILSSFATQEGSHVNPAHAGASVPEILKAMGPFGVKAGQFIRANRLASEEILKELDSFFDSAAPPERPKIYEDLERVFGKKAKQIHVRGLLGSASINYVIEADLLDENGKFLKNVVIRMQRDHISGRIENENEIWQRVQGKLATSADPNIQKVASGIEEARLATMESLGENGTELDLGYERRISSQAAQAYDAPVSKATGLKIEVAHPVPGIENWVEGTQKGKAELYEKVNFTKLSEVKDTRLRKAIAEQIVQAELNALFERGIFDPDGHPGNWLIDLQNNRLVRIDYSQLRQISQNDISNFKTGLSELLRPNGSAVASEDLFHALANWFTLQPGTDLEKLNESVKTVLRSGNFRHAPTGIQRVFAFRDALQKQMMTSVEIRPEMRAAMASLARISAYQEALGSTRFGQLIFGKLGLNLNQFALPLLQEKVKKGITDMRKGLVGALQNGAENAQQLINQGNSNLMRCYQVNFRLRLFGKSPFWED